MRKRELNNIKATEQLQIKFRVSPEEKRLLNIKREQYNYRYLKTFKYLFGNNFSHLEIMSMLSS